MGDDLGIGLTTENVPSRGKVVSQLSEVVDLPILNGGDSAVLGEYRLFPPLDIDDAEAAVSQKKVRTPAFVVAFIIRASVNHGPGHAPYHG
jgi:hypothetical protein